MAVNPTVRLIATLSNLIRRKIDSAEGVGGLTPAQNGILHFILGRCREQDLFQKDIEEEFNLRRPTATEILKLMERKGVMLEGQVLKDILEMEQFITRDIPKEELDTFIRIGMKMMKNLK